LGIGFSHMRVRGASGSASGLLVAGEVEGEAAQELAGGGQETSARRQVPGQIRMILGTA
jgi:hypothetical protein